MRPLLIIVFISATALYAQDDFETRFFSFNSESLPMVEDLSEFRFNDSPFVKRSLNEFELNTFNYRTTVNMMAAVSKDLPSRPRNVNIESLRQGLPGIRNEQAYISDGKTRVENQVYKEMRGLDLVDRCPPWGVCARCAPYRAGRRGF